MNILARKKSHESKVRKVSIYETEKDVKNAVHSKQSMILLMYKEAYFNTNDLRLVLLLKFCRNMKICFLRKCQMDYH